MGPITPVEPVMRTPLAFMAEITDGRAAWDEFVAGVGEVLEANAAAAWVIGLVVTVAVVIWVDVRVARWLVGSRSRDGDSDRA